MQSLLKWLKDKTTSKIRLAVAFDEQGFSFALIEDKFPRPFLKDCGYINCTAPEHFLKELKNICTTHHFEDLQCSLVLAPNQYSFYLIDAPDVQHKDLAESLKWRVKDYIEFPIEEAALDFVELPRSKFLDKRMVYQVASQRRLIIEQVELMKLAGFDVDIVDIPELATKNIARLLKENEEGEAFVKLHPKQSKIVLVRKGELYLMRNLEIDISGLFDRTPQSLTLEGRAQVRKLVDDLALEIQRSLDYCTSVLKQSPTRSLVFSPVSFPIDDFVDEMKSVLGFPVKILDCRDILDFNGDFDTETQSRCFSSLGAALRGVGDDN